MNKPVAGILIGAALGVVDGCTAWFYPEARPQIAGILMGSTIKGLLVGLICGFVARKVNSVKVGLAVGAGVGLLLAFLVAAMPQPNGQPHPYLPIMFPGFVLGALTGFLTQRTGTAPRAEA